MRRCPRCGNDNVSAHFGPASKWNAREEGYRCASCGLQESRYVTDSDYEEFLARWNEDRPTMTYAELARGVAHGNAIDEQRAREWTWPDEWPSGHWAAVSDREARARKLDEYWNETQYTHSTTRDGELRYSNHGRLPQNTELMQRILTSVDDEEPRLAYARWIATTDDPRAPEAASLIEWQVRIADALRRNPKQPITDELPPRLFDDPGRAIDWWHHPFDESNGVGAALADNLAILREEHLVADLRWYRGFVEHVAIKAHRFLEIADELYSLAPIRHLTITFAKGLDHTDEGVWRALLASPHLARIRSLRFLVHHIDHPKAELNRLTDADIEVLAASPMLKGLRYLDLEDNKRLRIGAFRALAASPHLRELSAVQLDEHYFEQLGVFTFGSVGPVERKLLRRHPPLYRRELEAEFGPLPWLHQLENYGTESPDLEAVVEHPFPRDR